MSLGNDRVSLLTTQPIGNAGTVRVRVNDDAVIPQGGLLRAAQLHSTVSGPFDLVAGEDELTVETPQGSQTISFNVFGTQRFKAAQVVQYLLRQGFSIAYAESVNDHLIFTDVSTIGSDSFIKVRGSAAASLGFGDTDSVSRQRGDRGRQLYPGWRLARRDDNSSYRFPQFTQPIRNNPIFKVTYSVPPANCKRCRGGHIENDIRFDNAGQSIFIENENLLQQAALKILMSDLGSNPYHTWYGTTIRSRIGSKAVGNVAATISEDVRRALSRLQDIQSSQAEYQQVTAKERLYAVLGVQTRPHKQDPTTFQVNVTVQNASSEPISLSVIFAVPQVVAVLGSNGLFLGPEAAALTQAIQQRLFPAGRTLLLPDGN